MNEKMKRGIIIALVAGFVTLLFGGWAVSVAGAIAGMGLGFFLGGKNTEKTIAAAIKAALGPICSAYDQGWNFQRRQTPP